MSDITTPSKRNATSRRDFLKTSAVGVTAASVAGNLSIARAAHARGDDLIRIGWIGCGGRGTGAVTQALSTQGPVKLMAMGDVFQGRMENRLKMLMRNPNIRDHIDVPPERQFVGLDAYQKVIDAGVDLVVLTTPPGFRPVQYQAAIKAGKHVFMEKPCAVDVPGFKMLLAANEEAKKKGLAVGVGLQRRHQDNYLEWIDQLRGGKVGDIQFIRTYFNMPGQITGPIRKSDQTEMEYQIRNWAVFTWLSGDHIVEQAIHVIDVANWVMNDYPIKANGMGGRQVRTGKGTGHIYDHHFIEYEYPNGTRYFCQARQIACTWCHVSEHVHGTKDTMTLGVGPYGGAAPYGGRRTYKGPNPYQQEQDDLFASIRKGEPLFEGDFAARSSLTAIMGRMATYSGKVVELDEIMNSTLSLAPERYALDADPPILPDDEGNYPVAVPGLTKAW